MTKLKYSAEVQNLLDSIAILKALKGKEIDPPLIAADVEDLSNERIVRAKLKFQEQIRALIQFADILKRDKYLSVYNTQFLNIISSLMESNEVIVFENSQLHSRNKSYRKALKHDN